MSVSKLTMFISSYLNRIALTSSQRLVLLLGVHGCIWICSLWLAYCVRFDFSPEDMGANWRGWGVLALFLVSRYTAFFYWNLQEISWRHVSTRDVSRIIKAHLAASVCLAAFLALIDVPHFPRSVIILHLVFSILGCIGAPLCVRMFFEALESRSAASSRAANRDVLIIGAGDSGHLLVKTLLARRQLHYSPIGILDDSPAMRGRSVHGIDVIGRVSDLADMLEANPTIAAVVLAIPSFSKVRVQEIERICGTFEVPLKRLQSFEDIAVTDFDSGSSTGLTIESVLQRDESISNEDEIRDFVSGKDIAVTGAGGSIGSELVRQLLNFNPASLTLIDSNEFHMFKLQREINGSGPATTKHYCVASIVDEGRICSLFHEHRPTILFHAAAYKHVPLMEENPYEAVQNNVIGTRNLLRACILSGVEHFVFISTDKAVNSCSVMGHSKRLGELLVQEYTAEARKRDKRFTSAIVRFGNVINSNGSVVPLFKEQILSGGPVTVTHPEMRRFFMSIREAVRLVMAAGTIGRDAEVFLLDMGVPVRIEDVARKMLALYGRRDIPIVYSGVRPGERLFEELTGPGEKTFSTPLSKVSRVVGPQTHKAEIINWVASIESRLSVMESADIREALAGIFNRPVSKDPERVLDALAG